MAWLLGFASVCSSILIEFANLYFSISKTELLGIITGFIAFKMLMDIMTYYAKQRVGMKSLSAVGSYPLLIKSD